jgi:C4-dicarboxylate-specific signal transduction histidine kinase
MLNFIGFVNTSELKGDQKVVAITDDEGMPDITVHRSRIPAWWAIINELVTNAARKYYNRDIDDKMVYLTAFEDGDSVRIIVADNGVGIPDDAVDSVFKGKRLRKDLANGDGLGLRGIKAEVEKMGGKVEINPDMSGINVPDEVEGMLDGMVTVMMITVSRSDLESEKTP